MLGALLLVALLVARGCASANRQVSQERAIEIARQATSFKPDRVQIRFLQQGIPPRAIWAVSLYNVGASGTPTRVNVVRVDAATGVVLRR